MLKVGISLRYHTTTQDLVEVGMSFQHLLFIFTVQCRYDVKDLVYHVSDCKELIEEKPNE